METVVRLKFIVMNRKRITNGWGVLNDNKRKSARGTRETEDTRGIKGTSRP